MHFWWDLKVGVRWFSLFSVHWNHQEIYCSTDYWTPPGNFVGVEQGSQICVSIKLPGDVRTQGSAVNWFFIFKIFIYLFIFLLYNIVSVLPYINMHLPRVYTRSPFWTPLPPPYLSHPSGSSQCTSPKLPVSCIEPGLVIRFLWYCTCFNAILPNHHPLHLPQSPKDCSIHLCLFCCLAYRVVVTIFLNSIYMR